MARRTNEEAVLLAWPTEVERAVDLLARPDTSTVLVESGIGSGSGAFVDAVATAARQSGRPVHRIQCDRSSRHLPLAAVAAWRDDSGASAVASTVRALAADGALICVERAHQLDDASAAVIAQAARLGAHLLLSIGSFRLLSPALAHLESDVPVVRVALRNLDDAEISRLAAAVLDGPVEPGLVRAVSALVGYAPAAIADVLRAARDAGTVRRSGRMWRQVGALSATPWLAAQVDDVVGDLDEELLEALDLLVLGASVPWPLARQVLGGATLERLESLGLAVHDAGADPRVELAEQAVRSVRRAVMVPSRVVRLAEQFGDAFEFWARTAAPLASVDQALRARLALAARRPLAVGEALSAARAAQQVGDLALAEDICRAALRTTSSVEVTLALSDLLTATGRAAQVEQLFDDLALGSDAEIALVAMARAVSLGMHLDRVADAIDVVDAARAVLTDEQWAGELVGMGGVLDLMLGRPDAALAAVGPYLDTGRGRGFVEAATAAGPSLVMLGRHEDSMDLSQRAFDERLALGEQPVLIGPGLHLLVRSLACAEAGLLAEAEELALLVTSAASSMGSSEGQMWGGVIGGRGLLNQGRFDEARVVFDIAAAAAMDLNLVLHLGWARGGSLLAMSQTRDAVAVRQCLDALDAVPTTQLGLMASELERARGWAAVALGDFRRGIDRLEAAADHAAAVGQPGLEVIAVHDLVRVGSRRAAPRLVEVASRVQGDLARVRSAHAQAIMADDHVACVEVSTQFEAMGAIVMAAEAATQAAWAARRQGRAGLADDAQSRAMRLRAMRPGASTPGLAAHAGFAMLTEREREVIEMAAAGSASKAIAAALGVSVRTVDNLLQRAYRKLEVSGRDDLRRLRLG